MFYSNVMPVEIFLDNKTVIGKDVTITVIEKRFEREK